MSCFLVFDVDKTLSREVLSFGKADLDLWIELIPIRVESLCPPLELRFFIVSYPFSHLRLWFWLSKGWLAV